MNQTNPPGHLADLPTASESAQISALLNADQDRAILPLRETTPDADETKPFDPPTTPQPALKLADKTKPSATNSVQETISDALPFDPTRHLLPPEFYQMTLDELHTAGGFLDLSDPSQANAFRLLLRRRLIEQDQKVAL